MTTNEHYLGVQSVINRNATAEIHNILQTYTIHTSGEMKRTLTISQPKGTSPYTVEDRDTIEKIALRFNSTPSELLHMNKLNSRMLFPGQVLYVPEDRPYEEPSIQESTEAVKSPTNVTKPHESEAFVLLSDRRLSDEKTASLPLPSSQLQHDVGPMVWSMTRQLVARPGRAHRLHSDPTESTTKPQTIEVHPSTQQENNTKQTEVVQETLASNENHHQVDEEYVQRFIKLNVRLMTDDRQNVSGTLLITPNAVMFDPDVLDPLVKEHGIDRYGLIIQMQYLAGIALYEDFAMFEHEATARDEEKRKNYHSTSVRQSQQNQFNQSFISDSEQIHELISNLLDKIEAELNPPTNTYKLFDAALSLQHRLSKNILDEQTPLPPLGDDDDIENAFQPLDEYRHSIGILLDDEIHHEKTTYSQVPSQGCHLENCVPIDQFNKRFTEIDKLLYQQHQTYFTPHSIEVPFYLCIKTTVYNHDIPSLNSRLYQRLSEKYKDSVYGVKQLEREYWFEVPKEKTDHLYSFFLRWTPEREFDPLIDDADELTKISQRNSTPNKGFVLLANEDPDLLEKYSNKNLSKQKQPHYLKRQSTLLKEWEIINVDEIYRRIDSTHEGTHPYDEGLPAPTLLQPSLLINEEQSKQISLELPFRFHGLKWYLTFSTEVHGFSLNQLYRRCFEIDHDLASLIIVKDIDQNMFGAFVSNQLVMSESFYGNGESFLFTYYPEFRVFNWSGANEFFVKGDVHGLGFGCGEGTYGLWVDSDLYHGRTSASKTYNNDPLTTIEDFLIANIEIWTFID